MTTYLLAAILVGGCGATAPTGPGSAPPDGAASALRAALPEPGAARPAGQAAFTGLDRSGRVAVALVRAWDGEVVAYVCDGATVWGWFEGVAPGKTVELSSAAGTLSARFDGDGWSGTASVRGADVEFVLEPALASTGLFRSVGGTDADPVEFGWVVANNGRVVGSAQRSATVVVDEAAADGGSGGATSVSGGADEPDPQLLRRFRCARLVLKVSAFEQDVLFSEIPLAEQDAANAENTANIAKFRELQCQDFFTL